MLNSETAGYPEQVASTKLFYISIYSTRCLTLSVRNLLSDNAELIPKQTPVCYTPGILQPWWRRTYAVSKAS